MRPDRTCPSSSRPSAPRCSTSTPTTRPSGPPQLCGLDAAQIRRIGELIGSALGRFSSHTWRASGAGNEGGWQTARCLWLLNVLTGSIGTTGGTSPNGWNKFIPVPPKPVHPHDQWNDITWPAEYPLAHHELSMLLPHFLKEGRGRLDTYFTRVYNPVWTNPDGFSWLEVLTDEELVGCHVALTPSWSETAWFADYVLPMGVGAERHDVASYETHTGRWIGFRQPVFKVFAEQQGRTVDRTWQVNPGEVWEENEWWIDLAFHIDPDGSLGIRSHFESPERPGHPISVDEYYEHLFTHSVPGLPEAAATEGLSPLQYMRRHGAFELPGDQYELHERMVPEQELETAGAVREDDGVYRVPGTAGRHDDLEDIGGHMPFIGDGSVGVEIDGVVRAGFPTPSRKLELYSEMLRDWGWPEYAVPTWIPSHVHWEDLDFLAGERILIPTFRLPTMIHTRGGNSKWLNEISHGHPLWIHPSDAEKLGIEVDGLVRVSTRLGWFVIRAWRTEGIRPGVVGASHHMGRWRLDDTRGAQRWSSGRVGITGPDGQSYGGATDGAGGAGQRWALRQQGGGRAVRIGRSGLRAGVVVGCRRPPEPDLSRATGSCLGDALLAAAGDSGPGAAGRPVRRRRRGHGPLDRGVSGVAGQGAARPWSRWAAASALAGPARQAGGHRLPRADSRLNLALHPADPDRGLALPGSSSETNAPPTARSAQSSRPDRRISLRRGACQAEMVDAPPPFATVGTGQGPAVLAPDGSVVDVLAGLPEASMARFTLAAGAVAVAVRHRTVSELWYVVSGRGQMWRCSGTTEEIVDLMPGTSLSIPVGTDFQFRATDDEALVAIGVTIPPWPGDGEAEATCGPWPPSVDAAPGLIGDPQPSSSQGPATAL